MAFSAEFDNITETTADFTATFTGGQASFGYYRYVLLTIDGREIEIRSNGQGGASSYFSYHVRNLEPDTRYSWEAQLGYQDGSSIVWLDLYDSGSFYTEPEQTAYVEPWSWTSSNGTASAAQTRAAYNVIMGTATVDNFHHNVWNDLVDKVAEARAALGYGWSRGQSSQYPTQNGCYVSAGDRLSADIYNGVRFNIGALITTGVTDRYPGDAITGNLFLALTDTLNEIIDTMINN